MSDWLISLEGTEAGRHLAMALALLAAVLHAAFGAMQKARFDPWIMRGAIDLSYGLIAIPFVLFVVPFPAPHMWPIFAAAFVIHVIYKLLQAQTYTFGAYTVVYPVVRGTGPLVTVVAAGFKDVEIVNEVNVKGLYEESTISFGVPDDEITEEQLKEAGNSMINMQVQAFKPSE